MNQETAPLYEKIFVARQPVFTSDMKIWGYELLFRHGEKAQAAMVTDGDQATAQVIADGYTIASAGLRAEAKALINFPRNLLVNLAPYVLPADRCVVEILETVQPEKDVLAACKELKSQGYVLALDDFVGQPGFEPLLEIADLVKVDILHKRPAEVAGIARNLARYGVVLLAEKVENQDMFKGLSAPRVHLFLGILLQQTGNRPRAQACLGGNDQDQAAEGTGFARYQHRQTRTDHPDGSFHLLQAAALHQFG